MKKTAQLIADRIISYFKQSQRNPSRIRFGVDQVMAHRFGRSGYIPNEQDFSVLDNELRLFGWCIVRPNVSEIVAVKLSSLETAVRISLSDAGKTPVVIETVPEKKFFVVGFRPASLTKEDVYHVFDYNSSSDPKTVVRMIKSNYVGLENFFAISDMDGEFYTTYGPVSHERSKHVWFFRDPEDASRKADELNTEITTN